MRRPRKRLVADSLPPSSTTFICALVSIPAALMPSVFFPAMTISVVPISSRSRWYVAVNHAGEVDGMCPAASIRAGASAADGEALASAASNQGVLPVRLHSAIACRLAPSAGDWNVMSQSMIGARVRKSATSLKALLNPGCFWATVSGL